MKSSTFFLLPFIGSAYAKPLASDAGSRIFSLSDMYDEVDTRAWIVSDNITLDDYEVPDESIPGIRLVDPADVEESSEFIGPSEEYELTALESRQDRITTQHRLGQTHVCWGCEVSVRANVKGAIEQLCRDMICDEGSTYVTRVRTGEFMGNLRIKARGRWVNLIRHHLIAAMQELSRDDTHTKFEHRWQVPIGKGGAAIVKCLMTRFPNFMAIVRRRNDIPRDEIYLNIQEPEDRDKRPFCASIGALGAITGILNGYAGGFFGLVSAGPCS